MIIKNNLWVPGIEVVLTEEEIAYANSVGSDRHYWALEMGLKDKHGFNGDSLTTHMAACRAEYAVAKVTGVEWQAGVNEFRWGSDVGPMEVRYRLDPSRDMILRHEDKKKADRVWWLVVGKSPRLRVVGWAVAREVMRDEYLAAHANRPEAWFVPQRALNPPGNERFREYVSAFNQRPVQAAASTRNRAAARRKGFTARQARNQPGV